MADAVAKVHLAERGLSDRVDVSSRGLTDRYSRWGSPAEPRMVASAHAVGPNVGVLASLSAHKSALLLRSEVLDPNALLFLVTTEHEVWARTAVGDDAIDAAKRQGRLFMIHSNGDDIQDPYFGDAALYAEVCKIIIRETAKSLDLAINRRL